MQRPADMAALGRAYTGLELGMQVLGGYYRTKGAWDNRNEDA